MCAGSPIIGAPITPSCRLMKLLQHDVDSGSNLAVATVGSEEACLLACVGKGTCKSAVYIAARGRCFLKSSTYTSSSKQAGSPFDLLFCQGAPPAKRNQQRLTSFAVAHRKANHSVLFSLLADQGSSYSSRM
jgi:hypothetical protein